ncbi:glycosyltransferase family 4 protein [Azonexus sp.]|uniref:glycosyltransferase family 4 protein n=1 Tax=Azonexus sp. TaxID=1872668 RepID=UPI0035AED690
MPVELILGNSNPRFSGVTSTMLQVLNEQQKYLNLAVMGKHHLPANVPSITFLEAAKLTQAPLPDGRWRVFHARRNDEMIQALLLKHIFNAKIKIVFTSTAQRHHSALTCWLMGKMDAVISTCAAAASYLENPPAVIIPHGIDKNLYHPPSDRTAAWDALGLPGKYGIGIFGRVREQKGIDILIEASLPLLKIYPEFSLVICGEITPGNEKFVAQQQHKISAAGLSQRVIFLGKQPFSRVPELFRAMSIVAALSRNEGFGLTVLEAMSSGAAVLASQAGAWPEIIEEGVEGYTAPCSDVAATRAQLEKLMRRPEYLPIMGERGRKKVEQFYTIEREAKALCDFFKTLM